MRISGISAGRLIYRERSGKRITGGRICLVIDAERLKHGNQRILTPLGGGLRLDLKGRRFLDGLGADFSHDLGENLECWIPDDKIQRVNRWFLTPSGREHSALRKLAEQLGPNGFELLTPREILSFREQFYKAFFGLQAKSARKVPNPMTNYLIEVFNVTTTAVVMEKLVAASRGKKPKVYFVTWDDIKKGKAADDTPIDPIAECLL